MTFASPWWLVGVPVTLVLFPLLAWGLARLRTARLRRFAEDRALARIAPPPPGATATLRMVLLALGTMALLVALARPQWGSSPERVRRRGLDVVFVLDTSLSMNAPALAGARESRLEAAHRSVVDLAEMLRGDRTALVVFAGEAQVLCPLTVDDGALALFLETADPDLLPLAGSDLGRGIAQAANAFRTNERKFKVIIVLSDGEDNEGRGISAARDAAERGIVIHSVGFGSTEGEPIPLLDEKGRPAGVKKDAAGHVVSTRLDERTLHAVAEAGSGIYVPWRAGDRGLRSIADAVAQMEKRELESTRAATREDHAELPLAIGFALLSLESIVGLVVRRKRAAVLTGAPAVEGAKGAAPPRAKRRFRRRSRARTSDAAKIAGLVAGLVAGAALEVRAASPAETGEKAFAEKRYDAAAEAFQQALEKDPESAVLHYDLGTALLQAGKLEEAIKALSHAAATGSPDIRARAQYNIGNAYHAIQKQKEALEAFRSALRTAPQDLDAKHNYEVAKRELESKPPPTPTPSPDPESSPSPSPSPESSPSPEPGSGEPSPSPGATPTPASEPSPSPGDASEQPTPGEGEPTPRPQGELDREEAERLLDALAAQERTDSPSRRKPPAERTLAKDW